MIILQFKCNSIYIYLIRLKLKFMKILSFWIRFLILWSRSTSKDVSFERLVLFTLVFIVSFFGWLEQVLLFGCFGQLIWAFGSQKLVEVLGHLRNELS